MKMNWQQVQGRKGRGAFLAVDDTSIYIRQVLSADGLPSGTWNLFVDGRLESTADSEFTAIAAAEATFRIVKAAKMAAEAAAA